MYRYGPVTKSKTFLCFGPVLAILIAIHAGIVSLQHVVKMFLHLCPIASATRALPRYRVQGARAAGRAKGGAEQRANGYRTYTERVPVADTVCDCCYVPVCPCRAVCPCLLNDESSQPGCRVGRGIGWGSRVCLRVHPCRVGRSDRYSTGTPPVLAGLILLCEPNE